MDTDIIALESLFVAKEALTAAKETADWTFWMTIGTWVAGIATLSAVITSLYISSRKPVAHVESSIYVGPYKYDDIDLFGEFYYVNNLGLLPIMISSIHWEFAGINSKYMRFTHQASSELPCRVEPGENATFFAPIKKRADWDKGFKELIESHQGDVKKIKAYVTLATGKRIKIKIKSEILDGIKKAN